MVIHETRAEAAAGLLCPGWAEAPWTGAVESGTRPRAVARGCPLCE
jgi:hypothetical protein